MYSPDFLKAELRLHAEMEKLYPTYQHFLQELVRIPSPIGEEEKAQDFVARKMCRLGLEVDTFEVDPTRLGGVPGFNPTPRNYKGRPCVVGVLKGQGQGRSFILNTHIDTAPVGELANWLYPPYAGIIQDGFLHGRGAWDDKAGCAECLMLVEGLKKAGIRLKGDLIIKSVIEDEVTGNGTLACLERGHVADAAIIVDGTWPERFSVSHMGQVWFRISLKGKSAPACFASRGLNPLTAVGMVVDALNHMVDDKNRSFSGPSRAGQKPIFVNIGKIWAGDWPGSVPTQCVLEGQYGFLPPLTNGEAKQELGDLLLELGRRPGWPLEDPPEIDFWGLDTPGLLGHNGNELVRLLKSTLSRLRGSQVVETFLTGHCDLRHYQANSWKSPIPACLYGPGGGKNAHVENEYFMLEHLTLGAQNLSSVVLAWCG